MLLSIGVRWFFLEPVQGEPEPAKAIESQAIGRAHRQGQSEIVTVIRYFMHTMSLPHWQNIYRFIIRNTIEYDAYMRNYGSTEAQGIILTSFINFLVLYTNHNIYKTSSNTTISVRNT